jgi:hypothetical protein
MAEYHCQQCLKHTPQKSYDLNHRNHILLMIFTAGVWLPIYGVLTLYSQTVKYCNVCGIINVKISPVVFILMFLGLFLSFEWIAVVLDFIVPMLERHFLT